MMEKQKRNARIKYRSDEGAKKKNGQPKLRTRSIRNINPDISDETAKRTMLALAMLTAFVVVSAELVVDRYIPVLTPESQVERLKEASEKQGETKQARQTAQTAHMFTTSNTAATFAEVGTPIPMPFVAAPAPDPISTLAFSGAMIAMAAIGAVKKKWRGMRKRRA